MSNIFEDNQREEIRFQNGNIVLYEPTIEDRERLKEIISKSSNDEKITIGINFIREIIRSLVKDGNFIDTMSDDEIEEKLNRGNRRLTLLYREIKKILDEIVEDIQYEQEQQIKTINSLVNILNSNKEAEMMKNKLDKFFKKNKLNLTIDEIINKGMASEELKQIIENTKKSVKNKKRK